MEANVGTKPVAESHAFDVAALQSHLEARLPGFAGPLTVEQFKGGQSNPTYKLITPTQSYVMRSKPGPVAKLLPSAHAIEREFAVMGGLYGTDVPVPRMHLLCDDESIIGRAFYVMEFVEGRVLWEQSLPAFDKPGRAAIYDEMNRVIAALHNVDVKAAGLEAYGKPGNYFERQIGRWTKQYQASITEPIEAMDRLIEWLPANIPASARDDSQARIVHGDFRLDNLVFAADEPRIVAVLDWELSTLGHPLADLAYNCLGYHMKEPPHGFATVDFATLGLPTESDYVAAYCRRTGRARIEHWNYYVAFSLFRLAAIAQGVYRRGLQGNSSNPESVKMSKAPRERAELAWSLVS